MTEPQAGRRGPEKEDDQRHDQHLPNRAGVVALILLDRLVTSVTPRRLANTPREEQEDRKYGTDGERWEKPPREKRDDHCNDGIRGKK